MGAAFRLPARLNKKIGQAMHQHDMFADGDRVMLAVSGGVDSLVLAAVMSLWQKKAPIGLTLLAHHIDHGFWLNDEHSKSPEQAIGLQLLRFGLQLEVAREWDLKEAERTCFRCSRNRRSQLFDRARQLRCNKIAFGHHKDDLIETFFLNALYSGNISTMVPNQQLFEGNLSIVRPLAYIEKNDVLELAHLLRLEPVKNLCPLAEDTRREKVRTVLEALFADEPAAKESVFAALGNVRRDYLL